MASSHAISPQLPKLGGTLRDGLEEKLFRGNKKPVVWLVMARAFLLSAAVWLNLVMGARVNVDETLGDAVLRHREAERLHLPA